MTNNDPATSRQLRVLIVEDDREIREMVALMVRGMGYAIVTAATGKEAIARLREQSADIVLLDLMMPEMDGFEFLAHLRNHAQWRTVPVLVATAVELSEEDLVRLNGQVVQVIRKIGQSPDALLRDLGKHLAGDGGEQRRRGEVAERARVPGAHRVRRDTGRELVEDRLQAPRLAWRRGRGAARAEELGAEPVVVDRGAHRALECVLVQVVQRRRPDRLAGVLEGGPRR